MTTKDDILEALTELFSDTSVSQRETMEMMREIRDRASEYADAIQDDLRNGREV